MLGRPICRWTRSATLSTCSTGPSCAMRLTEHNETPANRATSVLAWPAFSKISTSCRFSMPGILLSSRPSAAHSRAGLGRVLLFLAIAQRLRISGMGRVRISGTDTRGYKKGTSSKTFFVLLLLPYRALQCDRCLVITTFWNLFVPFHGAKAGSNPAGDTMVAITYTRNL